MTHRVLILSDDLLDASRVLGHARAAGFEAIQCRTLAELEAQLTPLPWLVAVDLHFPGFEPESIAARSAAIRWVAYGSHVDAARLRRARQAGFSEVLPRSSFFDHLAEIFAVVGER